MTAGLGLLATAVFGKGCAPTKQALPQKINGLCKPLRGTQGRIFEGILNGKHTYIRMHS